MSNVSKEEAAEAIAMIGKMRIFVTSRQRIKNPEGDALFDASMATLRAFIEAAPEKGGEAVVGGFDEWFDSRQWNPLFPILIRSAALEGWEAAKRHPAAAKEPGVKWRDIMQMRLSDDLMWFAKGDSIEGPRRPEHDDYDRWQWFCLAEPPALPKE